MCVSIVFAHGNIRGQSLLVPTHELTSKLAVPQIPPVNAPSTTAVAVTSEEIWGAVAEQAHEVTVLRT